MPKESYTTFGLDIGLTKLLEGIPDGRYVDIGCWEPQEYSNTYALYQRGWKGVGVDPNPTFAPKWAELRPKDTFLNCAVGEAGTAKYYMYDYSMANTIVPSNIVARASKEWKLEQVIDVPVRTLESIFEELSPVHLLCLDAEGHDLEILRTNHWGAYRPWVIVVEDYDFEIGKKRPEIAQFMRDKSYFPLMDYYVDTVYLEANFFRRFKAL